MNAVRAAVADALSRALGPVYVGFSGGRDSTVLLHAVASAAAHLRPQRLVAVHVHHGLQADADAWQRHCAAAAGSLGVEFLARRVRVPAGGSLEARARAARYRVFEELLDSADSRLFLAHHRDDQTETVLLRLFQGRGLYGMPDRRPLRHGALVRPLLGVAAADVADYARRRDLCWIEDPSNADERLDRNYLRHRVLPELRGRWPYLDQAVLAALGAHRLAEQRLVRPLGDLSRRPSLQIAELAGRAPGEGEELLRLWLQARGHQPPPRAALGELLRQLEQAGADRQPRLAVGSASLRGYAGRLYLVPPPPELADVYPISVPGTLHLPHGTVELLEDAAGFHIEGPLLVRFRQGGERLAVGGRHRPLKLLFQEARVPPWERSGYPLLFDDRGLLAVPGVAARTSAGAIRGPCWRARWLPR